MKIHGLQKITLLDFPGHVACTVFLGGCNFRCPYCHNYDLAIGAQPPVMESDEFFSFLETRRGRLDGVAITGGEPCLQKELPQLMSRIHELGFLVKLDTNGAFPDMLAHILNQGLADYVAMDIKNSPERYAHTVGLDAFPVDQVTRSISLLKESPVDYEFRTTVVAELHSASDFDAIGRWISGARRYFLQSFVDRESVPFAGFHAPTTEIMQHYAEIMSCYVPEVQIRGMD